MTFYARIATDFPRDPRMIAAGWQTRAVYIEALLYCRENLTDGLLHSLALPYWMPDMSPGIRKRHLNKLVELGALEADDDGWRFPHKVWARWNPTKAEVEAKRDEERQRKADYRARKRRGSQPSENVPTGQVVAATDRPRTSETKEKTKTKQARKRPRTDPREPVDKSDGCAAHVETALKIFAHSRPDVRNPTGFALKLDDERQQLTNHLRARPDATLRGMLTVLGLDAATATAAARKARIDVGPEPTIETPPPCERCDNTGWVQLDGVRGVSQCPDCHPAELGAAS